MEKKSITKITLQWRNGGKKKIRKENSVPSQEIGSRREFAVIARGYFRWAYAKMERTIVDTSVICVFIFSIRHPSLLADSRRHSQLGVRCLICSLCAIIAKQFIRLSVMQPCWRYVKVSTLLSIRWTLYSIQFYANMAKEMSQNHCRSHIVNDRAICLGVYERHLRNYVVIDFRFNDIKKEEEEEQNTI